jgi:hypothetical protein
VPPLVLVGLPVVQAHPERHGLGHSNRLQLAACGLQPAACRPAGLRSQVSSAHPGPETRGPRPSPSAMKS